LLNGQTTSAYTVFGQLERNTGLYLLIGFYYRGTTTLEPIM